MLRHVLCDVGVDVCVYVVCVVVCGIIVGDGDVCRCGGVKCMCVVAGVGVFAVAVG